MIPNCISNSCFLIEQIDYIVLFSAISRSCLSIFIAGIA